MVWIKRRRLMNFDHMESERAKSTLAAIAEQLGREIRIFTTSVDSITSIKESENSLPDSEVQDDFYEFTAEDYYRMTANKKEERFLKTRKIREQEEAARRSKLTKAVIRVRFPDNQTMEATFHPSEIIQNLMDLVKKAIARPELPFYLYTTPPKKEIKDLSQDFYSAGFVPGAIVYFSYNVPKDAENAWANSGPFLREDIITLNGLHLISNRTASTEPEPEPEPARPDPAPVQEVKSEAKKTVKPKWLKM